jgi:hypothetical protein
MLIHPFVSSTRATSPCDPTKSAQTVPLPNGSKTADREHLCRIILKKPSFSGRDFLPSWSHKSDSLLYQILVLTYTHTLRQAHSKPNKLDSHTSRFQSVPVNFSWKWTKDKVVRYQSLELAGWYQTVLYLWLESHVRWHIAMRSYLPMK